MTALRQVYVAVGQDCFFTPVYFDLKFVCSMYHGQANPYPSRNEGWSGICTEVSRQQWRVLKSEVVMASLCFFSVLVKVMSRVGLRLFWAS